VREALAGTKLALFSKSLKSQNLKRFFFSEGIWAFLHTLGEYSVQYFLVNPQQPKITGVKFSSEEIGRIFSTKIRDFKLWKMPQLLNFRLPEE